MFIGYKNPLGYYYLDKTYEYLGLTSEEVDHFPKFIARKIGRDIGLPEDLVYLEEYHTKYVKQGMDVTYYFKYSQRYWGKLFVYYRIIGDNFWVQANFKKRQFQSNVQRVALKKHQSKFRKYGEKTVKDYHKNYRLGKEHPTK